LLSSRRAWASVWYVALWSSTCGRAPEGEAIVRLQLRWDPFNGAEFGKNLAYLSIKLASSANRRFEFEKRGQLFIRTHDEPLSIAAMRVNNEDRSPVGIHAWDAASTPTGFAQIVGDNFPVLQSFG